MRRIATVALMLSLIGCFEGTKPELDRLHRAGVVAPPANGDKKDKEKPPASITPGSPTLYERLGRDEGLQRAATMALRDPSAKDLADKMTPQQLGTILVAATGDQPLNLPTLSEEEWNTLRLVVRGALLDLNISGADRDELIDRMTKGKR
jgi:hypothetical protein